MAFVKLDIVGDESSTVFFIGRVLQVPTPLLLLDKATQRLLVRGGNPLFDSAPNLEVLGGIAGLILPRSLPGNYEVARGEKPSS